MANIVASVDRAQQNPQKTSVCHKIDDGSAIKTEITEDIFISQLYAQQCVNSQHSGN